MAISLNDLNSQASKKVKSIIDVVLERKEAKLKARQEGIAIKKRVLRPWESLEELTNDSHYEPKKRNSIMRPFQKEPVLSDEEKMARRIHERAKELFTDLEY
mgnify:CR=1 FL=1